MAYWMQALKRNIVRIVVCFARLLGPFNKRGTAAVPYLLLLLIEHLLRALLPCES